MNEDRLDELENLALKHHIGADSVDVVQLIRLARLGLQAELLTPRIIALAEWAEKNGIPALKTLATQLACSCCNSDETVQKHFDQALAALPKEDT